MKENNNRAWTRYIGLTAQLLVMLAAGVFIGIWADKKLNVAPLFLIALPLLILIVTFYKLIKETNQSKKNE